MFFKMLRIMKDINSISMHPTRQNGDFHLGLLPSVWSSGMIPASGAGGLGFESRNRPFCFHC